MPAFAGIIDGPLALPVHSLAERPGETASGWDGAFQLLLFNEESLVSAGHQLALIPSLGL
jgi:hypothetical protein